LAAARTEAAPQRAQSSDARAPGNRVRVPATLVYLMASTMLAELRTVAAGAEPSVVLAALVLAPLAVALLLWWRRPSNLDYYRVPEVQSNRPIVGEGKFHMERATGGCRSGRQEVK
jgi:hypothetical protein